MLNIDEIKNTIICGDCLEVMKQLPDKCVDLVLTDPPYGENQAIWDKKRPDDIIWDKMFRVLKEGGSLYYWGFWGHADWVLGNAKRCGLTPQSRIVWWFATGRPENYSYREDTENCWYFSKGTPEYFNPEDYLEPYEDKSNYARYSRTGKHPGTVWRESRIFHNHPENVGHETQKPVSLFSKIVDISCHLGGIVLDPFLGSGTTAVACYRTRRNYIGIEISPEYCKIAEKRIQQEKDKLALFNGLEAS